MKKKKTDNTTGIVIPRRNENIGVSLPVLKREVACLLSSEDAKVSSSKILLGSVTLLSLGFMAQRAESCSPNCHWESLLHGNTHGSSYMATFAADLGVVHSSAPACHMNTVPGHASAAPHISSIAHSNAGTPHHNLAGSSGAINAHANTSADPAVTLGTFHNNGSQGAHTAQLGHNNLLNTHTNRPADHANAAPHVNGGTVAVTGIGGHTNTNSGHSSLGHCNMGGHFNALPVFNNHQNAHNSVFTGHSNNSHGSHGSHGQW